MENTVAHFIRKKSQLRASFIQNQISHHIDYKPIIIYRYQTNKDDGGFAEYSNTYIELNLSKNKLIDINFRYLKKLSKTDVKKVLNFLDYHNVSILHFHYGSDALIYTDIIRYSGRPSVVSFYGYDASSFRNSFGGYGGVLLKKRLFPYVTKVLAMSPDMKIDLIKSGCQEEKIIIHYHGSDVQHFYIKRSYSNNSIINFLIISGLEPQKGHIFLLDAFRMARSKCENIILNIYGKGSLEKKIRKYIAKNNMFKYVKMHASLVYGSPEHISALRNADVFIHPSVTAPNGDKEGIPGAIVEAMATGLPIISTYHAGIPYIIENNKTGILVKENQVNSLADAIIDLAIDHERRERLGKAAQIFALENLDLLKKEKELENIYNKLLL
ncbi:glycosyltransferase family 4 protein [Melioribacter sp. OK-6-Me]|uniref:glycosyltransferase family 4 protein n=1 Tax=Melioribacter sp. OK-6-Me TaxID=3423433 RepID=UPI003EDAD886